MSILFFLSPQNFSLFPHFNISLFQLPHYNTLFQVPFNEKAYLLPLAPPVTPHPHPLLPQSYTTPAYIPHPDSDPPEMEVHP